MPEKLWPNQEDLTLDPLGRFAKIDPWATRRWYCQKCNKSAQDKVAEYSPLWYENPLLTITPWNAR